MSLVALLGVVSLAAGAGDSGRAMPGGDLAGSFGHHAFAWFLLVVVPVFAVVGLIIFFYTQIARRRDPEIAAMRRRNSRRLAIAAFVILAIIVWGQQSGHNWFAGLHFHNPFASGNAHGHNATHPVPHGHSGGFGTIDWVVAGLTWLLIVAGIVLAIRQLRRREPAPEAVALAQPEGEAADTSLARLRAEADPRRAVIGAYALMDRLMADRNLGRQRSEAPLEYLGRMTSAGYARITALGRLTRLYARARFSTHPIDGAMQAEAVDAVEAIATEGGGR